MMKRLLTTACTLLLVLAIHAITTDVTPDNTGMTLSAQEWDKNVVMGWNLGNSLESSGGETGWGNPKTTQEIIKYVKSMGFNAIRIPVRWSEQLSDASAMTVKETWLKRVKEIVDWCLEEDMYVIINTHHEAWLDRNPFSSKKTENNRKLAALWKCIATYFRDYDQRLAFAGTNETVALVNGEENWNKPTAEWQEVQNSYNQTFVNAVRATGGKNYYRHLVVQTYACNAYYGLDGGFIVPTDVVERRLSVEFHCYDPYEYAGSGSYYYWGKKYKDMGKSVPSSDESTMENYFYRIKSNWWKKGLGVVLGEYGATCHYKSNEKQLQMENLQYYYACMVGNARKYGFAAFAWDNNVFGNGTEKFGIFRRSGSSATTVGNTYALKGICEGAAVDYQGPDDTGGGGGMVTLSWHLDNPLSGGSSWVADSLRDIETQTVPSVLEGGEKHELFLSWLDRVAQFLNSLETPYGVRVPVLFRPWHEHTGSWFWWGQQHCTAEQYKALWHLTIDRLRQQGVTNALYAYSPGTESDGDEAKYLERYPGDDCIDLLGLDCYCWAPDADTTQIARYAATLDKNLQMVCAVAKQHHKAVALTETGYECVKTTDWWTHALAPVLARHPICYALVWRNAHNRPNHFFAPYPGQQSASDFIRFYNDPRTLFLNDVNGLYIKQ